MERSFDESDTQKFEPLEPIDVRKSGRVQDLLDQMAQTAFGGRELGEAFSVLKEMADDP